MKEDNLIFFSSSFLYTGLVLFYQVKNTDEEIAMLMDDERIDRLRQFFPLQMTVLKD